MIPALSLQIEIISLKEEPSTEKKTTSQIYLTEINSLPVGAEEKPETSFQIPHRTSGSLSPMATKYTDTSQLLWSNLQLKITPPGLSTDNYSTSEPL